MQPFAGSRLTSHLGSAERGMEMWVPTQEQAVEMYARHFEALHRNGSATLARQTAAAMKAKGDNDGHKIWNEVADAIE